MSNPIPSADVTQTVSDALGTIVRLLGRVSVIDWILVGAAIMLLAWAWVRAIAFVRLGTIEIADLAADDNSLGPLGVKAELQKQLGDRGWLPASGVPSGSPTVANLATAVSQAPIAQANWLGALIALLPMPPSSTSFKLTGTLRTRRSDQGENEVGLSYQLVRAKPTVNVRLKEQWGSDWSTVIGAAAKEIYLLIGEDAPEIYPRWARWGKPDALTRYREGLECEQNVKSDPDGAVATYRAAYALYRRASETDPDNMLARLRAANCLERIAANQEPSMRVFTEIEALQAYISVRLRQPAIFEAGFRASVLLSALAERPPTHPDAVTRLQTVMGRLELARARDIDAAEQFRLWTLIAETRRAIKKIVASLRLEGSSQKRGARRSLGLELERAARRESRIARRRLRPLWTVLHEGRFRHRFEPTGTVRRQLHKALGVSQMCIRARRARDRSGLRPVPVSDLAQLCWRGWVYWRYMAGRSHVAGWQAHYNAACFYSLLPQASEQSTPLGPARVRRRALWHLARAVDQADGQFSCVYARDEDPDLQALRTLSSNGFRHVLGQLCPEDLDVHYCRPPAGDAWGLHVWGEAISPSVGRSWAKPLKPTSTAVDEAVYRIRIFDENKSLAILAHRGDEKDKPVWIFTPAEKSAAVWIYPGDPNVYVERRPTQ